MRNGFRCYTALPLSDIIWDMSHFLSFLLPQEERAQRAPIIHRPALAIYIFILLFFYVFVNFFKTAAPGILGFASDIFTDEIVELTNAERDRNGLPPLRLDPLLSEAARRKAEDMFADDYWAHIAPDGTKPWDFITGVGYNYVYAGENLAKDFQKSEAVVKAWMESPTHRQNILNEKFKDIGVAVVNGALNGYETTLVVQMFGQKVEYLASEPQKSAPPVLPSAQVQEVVPAPLFASGVGQEVEQKTEEVEIPPQSVTIEKPQEAQWSLGVRARPRVDVFSLTRTLSLVLGSMVLGFFTLDAYVAQRRGLVRLSGHTVAHFGLLILLLGIVWFLKPGTIL